MKTIKGPLRQGNSCMVAIRRRPANAFSHRPWTGTPQPCLLSAVPRHLLRARRGLFRVGKRDSQQSDGRWNRFSGVGRPPWTRAHQGVRVPGGGRELPPRPEDLGEVGLRQQGQPPTVPHAVLSGALVKARIRGCLLEECPVFAPSRPDFFVSSVCTAAGQPRRRLSATTATWPACGSGGPAWPSTRRRTGERSRECAAVRRDR